MPEFTGEPPRFTKKIQARAFATFEEGVVRSACNLTRDPEANWALCRRAREDRRGSGGDDYRDGPSPEDLSGAGFPLRVRSVRVNVSAIHAFLVEFRKTGLYAEWVAASEAEPGRRTTLVFQWKGWGTCALTDAAWAAELPAVLVLRPNEGEELFVADWGVLVKNSGWSAVE